MNFLFHMLDFQLINNERFINYTHSKERTKMSRIQIRLDILNDLMGSANRGIVSKRQGKGYLDKLGLAKEIIKMRQLKEKRGDFDQ